MLNPRTLALKLEYHLFKKDGAFLRRFVSPARQAALRRQLRAKYLLWDARRYRAWQKKTMAERQVRYAGRLEPGLLSLLTPVWDGTPLEYFRLLVESIVQQNPAGAVEWVVLDNGCQGEQILTYFSALEQHSWINIVRSPQNAGIIGGLRFCLEAATGRYVLPVDADDLLYPDCLPIVTRWIIQTGHPPILYTDEDKIIGSVAVQPYLKPDFDPVLLLNSAYIAHLGVIDRRLALEHGAYMDKSTEGSPDWDLFTRFFVAGKPAVHIPEVVYSWRMHPESTADDAGSKPYIHSSQRAVLVRYLESSGLASKFDIEYSPLLPGSCDWWVRRRAFDPAAALLVSLTTGASPAAQTVHYPDLRRFSLDAQASAKSLADLVLSKAQSDADLICLLSDDLILDRCDWLWEALGLFERFGDAAMIGGRIRNSAGKIISANYVLGFGHVCECPDRGRAALDPGYFTQMMKQHSASAVSSQFAVLRAATIREISRNLPSKASLGHLGVWAGAWALREDKRVIYSPFLSGVSDIHWGARAGSEEMQEFLRQNSDLIPDTRYYPAALSRERGRAYELTA